MSQSITTQAYVARTPINNTDINIDLEKVSYAPPKDKEVVVEIVASSICHTDIKTAQGQFHLKPPLVLGHEASGYVRNVGDKVTYVTEGDAVVLSYSHCESCRRCLAGKQAYCDELFGMNFMGREVRDADGVGKGVKGGFFGQSSMGRMAVVHESCCVRVGEVRREELVLFASLGCGVQTGAGAILNVARPEVGSRVVVFGGGAVGLSAIMAAKLSGPECLVLVDNNQTKLDMIPKEILEGVEVVNSSGREPGKTAAKLKELTKDGRGIDFALDCTGNEAVIVEAHTCLDKLGTLINVGSSSTAKAGYSIASQLVRGITTRGTHQGDSVSRVMIPLLIDLWRSGKFPFDQLLTPYDFRDLHMALEDLKSGSVVKPLLVMEERH